MRVLIIEDEVPLAEAVARGLRREGYEVECVHDGLTGFTRARDGGFDAVILDILLPKMNGYKVCENLRGEGVWTPILMLTAKDGEYDEAEALDTGADDFLSKPFSYVVLLARLRALLRRGVPKVATLQIGVAQPRPGPAHVPPRGQGDRAHPARVHAARGVDAPRRRGCAEG